MSKSNRKHTVEREPNWTLEGFIIRGVAGLIMAVPSLIGMVVVLNFLFTIERVIPYVLVWAVPLGMAILMVLGFIVNEILLAMYGRGYFHGDREDAMNRKGKK